MMRAVGQQIIMISGLGAVLRENLITFDFLLLHGAEEKG